MSALAWDCAACGHHNDAGAVCDACGVAKRFLDDPPLDLPYPPHLTELPEFYLALLWSLATLLGLALLAEPAWRTALGLGPAFLALEAASALGAAWTSWSEAFWRLNFNEARLEVPDTVKSGEAFEAVLTLVPYRPLRNVHAEFRLVDNFYQHDASGGGVETRSRSLGRVLALLGEPLTGRRAHVLHAGFLAPFPATKHTDIVAEVMASLLAAFGWLVPGLAFTARNLRQHGGYFVSATVRVGWLRRTYKRRVIAYFVGADLFVG